MCYELAAAFCQDDTELSYGVKVEANGLEHGGLENADLKPRPKF